MVSTTPKPQSPEDPLSEETPPIDSTCDQIHDISNSNGNEVPSKETAAEVKNALEKFTFTEAHDDDDDFSIKSGEKILEPAKTSGSSGSSTPHTPMPRKRFSIGSKSVIPSLLNAQLHNINLFEDKQNGKTKEMTEDAVGAAKEIRTCLEHDLARISSALMTKRQLGKIVGGIRDIERTLNHVNIRAKIVNIMILTKIYDQEPNEWARVVSTFLLKYNKDINLYIQQELRDNEYYKYNELIGLDPSFEKRIHFWYGDKCEHRPEIFDLIITFGGDGTVLYASWLFQTIIPPVLPFCLGSLGFLTEFKVDDHEAILTRIIENGYQCSIRMRFECTVMKSINPKDDRNLTEEIKNLNLKQKTHEIQETYCVFNEVVVDRGPNANMTSLEVYGDREALTTAEADGLIISTPSGSTAYSLSAGGSLVHPEIPGILISPICPHTLSFRPLVIPESMILRLGVPYDARSTAWCSFDGKNRIELRKGDFVTVTASRFPLPCIKNSESKNAWFERLSETLHWNERKHQKPLNMRNGPDFEMGLEKDANVDG